MVGLGNVNNTSDLNKPISTAVQNALNNYQLITGMSNYLLISNGYTKTEVDTLLSSVSSTVSPSSNLNVGSISINNNIAGINNSANIYGRSISIVSSDVWNTFNINSTDGFKYLYSRLILPSTIITGGLQSNSTGSIMNFGTNNITVNSSGISTSPLKITTIDTTSPLTIKNLK